MKILKTFGWLFLLYSISAIIVYFTMPDWLFISNAHFFASCAENLAFLGFIFTMRAFLKGRGL